MRNYTLLLFILIGILTIAGCKKEPELPNLLETLRADSDFSRFVEAIEYAEVEAVFEGASVLTILAPRNAAVDTFLARQGYDDIMDVPREFMEQTIYYHLQQGIISEIEFVPNYYLTPTTNAPGNRPLAILIDELNGDLAFNRQAKIVRANIVAFNGIIHKINSMLVMPNLMQMLENDSQFDNITEAINRSGLRSQFTGNDPLTLFAPPDGAFEQYFDDKPGVVSLNDLTTEQMKEIVQTHTIKGNNTVEDFQTIFTNEPFDNLLPGGTLNISRPLDIVILNDSVATLLMNVQATNGVIHLVDGVIEP